MNDQAAKAEKLRQLHHGPKILVLPNAWDAASARIFEDAGFPAIATTSAGVAFSLGYPDGQLIPREEMLGVVKRIAHSVQVPVTADLEAGYGDAAKTAESAIEAGAVGLNLEDFDHADGKKLFSITEQVEKIKTIRRVSDKLGVRLVINARTDQYLAEIGEPSTRFAEAMQTPAGLHRRRRGLRFRSRRDRRRNAPPPGGRIKISAQCAGPAAFAGHFAFAAARNRPRQYRRRNHPRGDGPDPARRARTARFRNVPRHVRRRHALGRGEQAVREINSRRPRDHSSTPGSRTLDFRARPHVSFLFRTPRTKVKIYAYSIHGIECALAGPHSQ